MLPQLVAVDFNPWTSSTPLSVNLVCFEKDTVLMLRSIRREAFQFCITICPLSLLGKKTEGEVFFSQNLFPSLC